MTRINPYLGHTSSFGRGIINTIGQTPLLPLDRLFSESPIELFGKLELFNPGGSIKDRVACNMLVAAMREGAIDTDSTIIESSSGNLGIGLAQLCRYLNMRFICVVDSRTTQQNINILRAYGAEVEIVTQPDPDLLTARIKRVQSLLRSIPGGFWCNQYANINNSHAHYQTMREIVQDMGAAPDYIFCATSTCGTLRGCAEYIHEHNLPTKVIAVDAQGSVIFGGVAGSRLIPGHGASRIPELFHSQLADSVVHVSDADCVRGCRRLLSREAILAGGSAGGAISAIERLLPRLPLNARCVVILCDRGERYMDTIFDDEWVAHNLGPDVVEEARYLDAGLQQRVV